MIKLIQFQFNPVGENTYIVYDETGECVIIDAGCFNKDEQNILIETIKEKNLKPVKLLCTHGHFDHIMGNAFVCNTYKIDSYINKEDLYLLSNANSYSSFYNIKIEEPPQPSHFINDGDEISFGNSSFKVITTPGHSPGSVCFYSAENELLFSGDTLFAGSIGRTDLPGGDYDVLMNSLMRLIEIPDNTTVFCGHGPQTTIGREKTTNPFIIERL